MKNIIKKPRPLNSRGFSIRAIIQVLLATFAVPAAGTGHASFFVHYGIFILTLWATVAGLGSVGDKLFKAAKYAVLPGGNAVVIETEVINQFNHIGQRHSMPEDT